MRNKKGKIGMYIYYKHMAGLGIECRTPATLIRSSTTEIPKPISTVNIVPTAIFELTESLIDFSCLRMY